MIDLDRDFKETFPTFKFSLKQIQKDSINKVINNGNTLCILPTGAGKSLIYWMSGVETGGITLVVSPLIALISEQAEKLEKQGFNVLAFHGGLSSKKQIDLLVQFANGGINPDFIFVSPEKIATDGLFEFCMKRRKDDIRLLTIDEVHCVSQWGISFRPFYKRIPDFLNAVFGNQWPKVLAMTATLNPKELDDVCTLFRIEKANIVREPLLMRSEIQLHVHKFSNENEKEEKFWQIVSIHRDEKTLVYVYRKQNTRSVEDLCQKAIEKGYRAAWFHGDMNSNERMEIIGKYRSGEINLVFATNAFGMGIDIPDIRTVIHFMIPESAEQFYQEIGRAARDGAGANAYLLYTNKNIDVKRTHFIDRSFPSEEKLREVFKKINHKEGYRAQPYFEDEELQQCLPYYLSAGLVDIECKGFSNIKDLSEINDLELQTYYNSTKNKAYVMTLKKCGIEPMALSECVYRCIADGKVKVDKALTKWLILNIHNTNITDEQMAQMLSDIEEKKEYKHQLLNYLVFLLNENLNSQQLHQELARYLGTDKHHLALIYKTADGNNVRSKSEVIISDLLYANGINYVYEEKLYYDDKHWIEPDFTIKREGLPDIYWEHVGMLGKEDYDENWTKKVRIYETYYPGRMIKTYESGAISQDAMRKIEELKSM